MLPGVKFPGEEIVRAALTLVREQGGYAPCPRRACSLQNRTTKRGASSFGSSSFSRLRMRHISCGVCRR